MIERCANPDCRATFDYREGRFFRFPRRSHAGQPARNSHAVEHFWFCGRCSEIYTLSFDEAAGVTLKLRHRSSHLDLRPRQLA